MVKELFDLKPECYGEYTRLTMLPYLIEKRGFKCAIYGFGRGGKIVENWLRVSYGISPAFFIDRGKSGYSDRGIPVIPLQEFEKHREENQNVFVIVAVYDYIEKPDVKKKIDEALEQCGVRLIQGAHRMLARVAPLRWDYVREHADDLEKTYAKFPDRLSRETCVEYLKMLVLGQGYSGKTFPEKYKYWGIDGERDQLFRFTEDEVFLNLGAAMGDTIYQYINCGNPYQKIIGVEGDKETFALLKDSMSYLEEPLRSKIQLDNVMLGGENNTIDNLYGDEKITLINMDIEGSELEVLEAAKLTIVKNRPVLAICVYHRDDDLVKIPEFVEENLKDYTLALRKYPDVYMSNIWGWLHSSELVLYAIPNERYIRKDEKEF